MKTPRKTAPRPPVTLSASARKWWRTIAEEYAIADGAGILILNTAAEAFDRMREAQGALAKAGLVTTDRHGQLRAHPLCAVERDNRAQMLGALKQLNLDLEPSEPRIGRPAGLPKKLRIV